MAHRTITTNVDGVTDFSNVDMASTLYNQPQLSTPEPSSLLLFGVGTLALAAFRGRGLIRTLSRRARQCSCSHLCRPQKLR
jgi:hypothetical protein